MKLDFAFFANHAEVYSNGLFSVLGGGITLFNLTALPAVCQSLVLMARVHFEQEECDAEYTCVAKVISPSGKSLSPDMEIDMKTKRQAFPSFVLLYRYNGFVFIESGIYRFSLFVGERHLGDATLEVTAPMAEENV